MESENDGFLFAIACGLITIGAYAPSWARKTLAGATASMIAPLIVSGIASDVLNTVCAKASIASIIDGIVERMVSPSFMCKLIFIRIFVLLSMVTSYRAVVPETPIPTVVPDTPITTAVGETPIPTAVAETPITTAVVQTPIPTADDSTNTSASSPCDVIADEERCGRDSSCIYIFGATKKCQSLMSFVEPNSILTTRAFSACGSYFQDELGASGGIRVGVRAPFLLTVQFLASLLTHLPNHITGPPILYTTLVKQIQMLSGMLREGDQAVTLGAIVPVLATIGEVLMWTWSSLNLYADTNLQAYTHAIAMAFYILGNSNMNCFILSIFARVFAPSTFFLPTSNASQRHGGCSSILDGSAVPENFSDGKTINGHVDMAFLYDTKEGRAHLHSSCSAAGFNADDAMKTTLYCRRVSYTPVVIQTKRQ
jgi:hypothetical protein